MDRCKASTLSSLLITSNRVTTIDLLSETDNPADNCKVCPRQACAITASSECALQNLADLTYMASLSISSAYLLKLSNAFECIISGSMYVPLTNAMCQKK